MKTQLSFSFCGMVAMFSKWASIIGHQGRLGVTSTIDPEKPFWSIFWKLLVHCITQNSLIMNSNKMSLLANAVFFFFLGCFVQFRLPVTTHGNQPVYLGYHKWYWLCVFPSDIIHLTRKWVVFLRTIMIGDDQGMDDIWITVWQHCLDKIRCLLLEVSRDVPWWWVISRVHRMLNECNMSKVVMIIIMIIE